MQGINFGMAKGLSYVNNWEADISRVGRHYQIQQQVNQQKAAEAKFWTDMMKQAPPQNDFDRTNYEKFALETTNQMVDIAKNNPNYKYDVRALTDLNLLSSKLLNNEHIVRDKTFQDEVKAFNDYYQKNPTDKMNFAEEYNTFARKLYNYTKTGNTEFDDPTAVPRGIDEKPEIKEFKFVHPVEMNVLDETKKILDLRDKFQTKAIVSKGDVNYDQISYAPEAKISATNLTYNNNQGGWDRLFHGFTPEFRAMYSDNVKEYIYKEMIEPTFKDEEKYLGLNRAARISNNNGGGKNEPDLTSTYFSNVLAPGLGATGKAEASKDNLAFLTRDIVNQAGGYKMPKYSSSNGHLRISLPDGNTKAFFNKGQGIFIHNATGSIEKIDNNYYTNAEIFVTEDEYNSVYKNAGIPGKKVENYIGPENKSLVNEDVSAGEEDALNQSGYNPAFASMSGSKKVPEGQPGYLISNVKLKLDMSAENINTYEKGKGGSKWVNDRMVKSNYGIIEGAPKGFMIDKVNNKPVYQYKNGKTSELNMTTKIIGGVEYKVYYDDKGWKAKVHKDAQGQVHTEYLTDEYK